MFRDLRDQVNVVAAAGAAVAVGLLTGCSQPGPPPNVVLIVVDTLREDAVGACGAPDRATPTLDALAARGSCFRSCTAHSPWTTPSLGSILTGQYPSRHGADWLSHSLATDVPTLAEMLRDAGYATGGFISHRLAGRQYGFARGFDTFNEKNAAGHQHVSSRILVDFAIRWLQSTEEPFFLFVHFFDPHYSYMEHEGWTLAPAYQGDIVPGMTVWDLRGRELREDDVAYLRALYAGEVRFFDAQLRRLLNYLEVEDQLDRTLIVVTADHGEEFLEHDWLGHTTNLHEGLLRVPLIVWAPSWSPGLREEAAASIDLVPTIRSIVRLPPLKTPGWDLSRPRRSTRPLYAEVEFASRDTTAPVTPRETEFRRVIAAKTAVQRSVREGNWKAIHDRLSDGWSLYDLESDPGEIQDRAEEEPEVLARLQDSLDEWIEDTQRGTAESVVLDAVDLERLRALGYTQ